MHTYTTIQKNHLRLVTLPVLLVFLLLCAYGRAQTIFEGFYPSAVTPGEHLFYDVSETTDHGLLITGQVNRIVNSYVYAVKLDSAGAQVWSKTYGNSMRGASGIETSNGGHIFIGARSNNFSIIRTDATGNIIWDRDYSASPTLDAYQIKQSPDGGYLIAGYTSGVPDAFLLKIDPLGMVQWAKRYAVSSTDYFHAFEDAYGGGYILAGQCNGGPSDILITRTDDWGNILWSKVYAGTAADFAAGIRKTPDGGYIVGGGSMTGSAGVEDFFAMKIDSSGTLLWARTYGGPQQDLCGDIAVLSNGNYVLTGMSESYGAGNVDGLFLCIDPAGNLLWAKTKGGVNETFLEGITATHDGGLAVAATSNGIAGAQTYNGGYIFKTGPSGNSACNGPNCNPITGIPFLTVSNGGSASALTVNSVTGSASAAVFAGSTAPQTLCSYTCNLAVTVQGTDSICAGTSVLLTASGAPSYMWNTGATSAAIQVNPAVTTTYTAMAQDSLCADSDEHTVTVLPNGSALINADAGTNIQLACPGLFYDLAPQSVQGPYTYSWTGPGSFSSGEWDPDTLLYQPGTYYLTAADPVSGCVVSDSVLVLQGAAPVASFIALSDNGLAPLTVSLDNTSTNNTAFSWHIESTVINGIDSLNYLFQQHGTYQVMLIASNGNALCNDTSYHSITVFAEDTIRIPNVFSPNGDGTNEIFQPVIYPASGLHMQIFDRWGLKLFEAENKNVYWDGRTTSGVPCPDGTYFYIIEATTLPDKIQKVYTGFLLLIH